ncbi:MAG: helix-turn-helix domain-containing protein [Ruminococcaceae bacterium]|nr:helix-turn-helix domain-containing protein [Oscillospiraceae bacterium]
MHMPVRWRMEDMIDDRPDLPPPRKHGSSHDMPMREHIMKSPICDACHVRERGSSVLHGHHHFLLTLVTRGKGIQTLNGAEIPFGVDDLFLLSPADFHSHTIPDDETFDFYRVCFPYELLDARLSELCALDRLPLHLHLPEETARTACGIFSQLVDESAHGHDRPGHRVYLQALVEQLLILVLRELPEHPASSPSTPVNRALGYLHTHFHEPISVGDAAAFVGYTPNYFNACFRDQMGQPFGEYLRRMRLTYAENLLRASALPVTEIAFESGFGSLPHFSRSFRGMYGMSPLEYRKKYLETVSEPI